MRYDSIQTVHECLLQFNNCSRYAAHSRVDDALMQFARHQDRTWHPSIVQVGVNRFAGAVRTTNIVVVQALHQANWRQLPEVVTGQAVSCLVEVTPKKPAQYSAFRGVEFASEFVRERIARSPAFESFESSHMGSSLVQIAKLSRPYSVPSAWFSITGKVASPLAFQQLILEGIGGNHSFGLGLLTPESSPFYATAKHALAMANSEAACAA